MIYRVCAGPDIQEREMARLLRNDSPEALTLQQAFEREKKRMRERQREVRRQTESLAREGRGADTEVAHLTPGELVVPRALQNPEVMAALARAAAERNIPLEMLSVGNAANRINPTTGAPEFGLLSGFGDWAQTQFAEDYLRSGLGRRENRQASNAASPGNDNNDSSVCKTAGYECLERAQNPSQSRACLTAEQACHMSARAADNYPENARIIARFPHGRTVVIPGGRMPPFLGPMTPVHQ